jgi:23S rRNA U2552 (ribose-2'-O)-methylase RlmE/FtsJ
MIFSILIDLASAPGAMDSIAASGTEAKIAGLDVQTQLSRDNPAHIQQI